MYKRQNQNTDFDFQIIYNDGLFNLDSSLGKNLNINGYYRNNDDLNFDISILDLIINNLYQINKTPITAIFNLLIIYHFPIILLL